MKELEDSPYFPQLLRNFQTDFIGFVALKFNFYSDFIKYIHSRLLSPQPMFDLCSGSGEPALSIFKASNCFSHLTLSDKYPNRCKKNFYLPQSIDVLAMTFEAGKYYTMFNAFHHFDDKSKQRIANKISGAGSHGFFVEILEPRFVCLLKVLLITAVGTFLFTPFVRPFSLKRIFFTYVLPLNILTITYDGILSVIRSRSAKTYNKLFASSKNFISVAKLKTSLHFLIIIHIKPEHENS